jgi:hypothetical protein
MTTTLQQPRGRGNDHDRPLRVSNYRRRIVV